MDILCNPSISYVIDATSQKAASITAGTLKSEDYQTTYNQWTPVFQMYIHKLTAEWSGTGAFTYTENGATVTITGITINPTLADSLYATS